MIWNSIKILGFTDYGKLNDVKKSHYSIIGVSLCWILYSLIAMFVLKRIN